MSCIDLKGITFDRVPAQAVPLETYRQLREIDRDAYGAAIRAANPEPPLTSMELEYFLDSPMGYVETHQNPNQLIARGRARPQQHYSRPMISAAYDGERPIGYAFSANNVSGATTLRRSVKRLTTAKNYCTLRSVAVHTDYQGRGISHALGFMAYSSVSPERPVTAYTWPKLLPYMDGLLRGWDLDPSNEDDPDPVYPFGWSGQSREVEQVRYASLQAEQVTTRIAQILGPAGVKRLADFAPLYAGLTQ